MQEPRERVAWGAAFLSVVVGVGIAQVIALPVEPKGVTATVVSEALIVLTLTGGLLVLPLADDLSGLDGEVIDGVYPPLMLGLSLVAVHALTDLVDEFLVRSVPAVSVFADFAMFFGLGAVLLGLTRWSRYQDERARLFRNQRDELSEKNDRLEQFASVVSHDLRNPLEVAQGRLRYARETGDDVHFEEIRRALDRIEAIVGDVLVLARADEDPDRKRVVVGEVASDAWSTVRTDGVGFRTNGVDAQSIRADPRRLRQLFENLFRNAVEHGSTDGRPGADDVPGEGNGDLEVRVGSLEGGFYVEDTGDGIPEEDRERVFDAGYTTSTEGTGLGLNLVREVAESHDWSVSVEDSPEGGARFEFRQEPPRSAE